MLYLFIATTVLFAVLWFVSLRAFENDIREIIIQWGLKGLFEARSQMNKPSDKLMEKSKTLDIIAFGLSSLRNSNNIKMLEERIKKGEIHVRILTLDPNSVFCEAVDKFEKATKDHTKETIQQLIEWVKQFNKKNFEIRTYNSIPLEFYYRFDSDIFVGPHQTRLSQQTFTMRFSTAGTASEIYMQNFDIAWESANKIEK